MELTSTRSTTFQNYLTIQLGTRLYVHTINHQSDKFGIEHHISQTLTLEIGRIEYHYAINGFHYDGAVSHLSRTSIEESIVGNIILIDISLYMIDLVTTHIETGHAIAGRYPYMMLVILNNGMYHLIEKSILAGEMLNGFTWALQC